MFSPKLTTAIAVVALSTSSLVAAGSATAAPSAHAAAATTSSDPASTPSSITVSGLYRYFDGHVKVRYRLGGGIPGATAAIENRTLGYTSVSHTFDADGHLVVDGITMRPGVVNDIRIVADSSAPGGEPVTTPIPFDDTRPGFDAPTVDTREDASTGVAALSITGRPFAEVSVVGDDGTVLAEPVELNQDGFRIIRIPLPTEATRITVTQTFQGAASESTTLTVGRR